MNSEFKTINFMRMLNRFMLALNVILGIVVMSIQKPVGIIIEFPFTWSGVGIIIVGIILYYIFRFIIEWAEDTKYIRKSSQEIVELLRKQSTDQWQKSFNNKSIFKIRPLSASHSIDKAFTNQTIQLWYRATATK